jgi:hypothetical protein
MSDDKSRLSGWCSGPPGTDPDHYHDACRWELCQCPNHVDQREGD